MAKAVSPSKEERQRAAERAKEWREFRQNFLYTQQYLASVLQCGRRTIVSIEHAEIMQPNYDLLRRFKALRQRHERAAAAHAERVAPMYANAGQLMQRGA